jgi:hypothetical protein
LACMNPLSKRFLLPSARDFLTQYFLTQ